MQNDDDELDLTPEEEAEIAMVDGMFHRDPTPTAPPPSAGRRMPVMGALGILMALSLVAAPSVVDGDE